MAHQYVYLLFAKESDHYAEMTAISMQTLRLTNPGAHIILLANAETCLCKSHGMQLIHTLANAVIQTEVPFDDALMGSRFLKTNMRNLVEGDFVYLDGDTLILDALDTIWETKADFAACLDEPNSGAEFKQMRVEIFKNLGWTLKVDQYINFGVALMRDTPAMREFGRQFYDLWQQQIARTGKHNDQFALNHLLSASSIKQKLLPRAYNAQFWMDPLAAKNAKVLHVFTGKFDDRNDTVLHVLAKKLKKDGVMDIEALKQLIASGNPWLVLDSVRKNLAMEHYAEAIRLYLKKWLKRFNLLKIPA